jgi:predicted ATPase
MHFDQGRDYARAALYRRQAAETALQRYAYQQAVDHLIRGLEVLKTLPVTPENVQHALELQALLGMVLSVTKGFAAPEAAQAYARARELCQQVGDTPYLFPVLWGLWVHSLVRTELHTARELGMELMGMAQSPLAPASHLKRAYNVQGVTLFSLGEFVSAREHFEQNLALAQIEQRSVLDFFYGQDPEAVSLAYLSCVLWFLGYPDQALRKSQEALAVARALSHPHSLALVLHSATWVHQLRRELLIMQERIAELLALTSQEGFAYWTAQGTMWQGWLLSAQGKHAPGIAQILQGLTARQATGASPYRASHFALLAWAHGKAGQVEDGLRVVAEALARADSTGDRAYAAELYRLKGELLVQQHPPDPSQAECCFQQALAIARGQQAKSWELRAAVSLSRLWQQQGQVPAAYKLLAEVYGWFTEGLDTADLQEAKALLEELCQLIAGQHSHQTIEDMTTSGLDSHPAVGMAASSCHISNPRRIS